MSTDDPSFARDAAGNAGLSRQQVWQFREMARHPEIVEKIIEESTDQDPPSRRKIMAAIRQAKALPEGSDISRRAAALVKKLRARDRAVDDDEAAVLTELAGVIDELLRR